MSLLEKIRELAASLSLDISEEHEVFKIYAVIAERKVFLSRQKLEYMAKFRIDDTAKVLKFTEMLKESKSGLSSGEVSPGFGFKVESYNLRGKMREGTIEEQSTLFGKKYEYKFDFKTIRSQIEKLAGEAGYIFKYQITSIGL
jgi:hypothetical protein